MDTPSEAVRRKSKKNVMSRDVKYLSVKNLRPIWELVLGRLA